MSSVSPAALEIDGILYTVVDRVDVEDGIPFDWKPYAEKVEPLVLQRSDTPGESRPGKASRPDILTWKFDTFDQGEGQKYINQEEEDSFKRYWYSDGAVDVRVPGQLSLGLLLTDDTAGFGNCTQGPYLAVTNGFLTAIGTDTVAAAQRARRKDLSTGTWSALSVTGIPAGARTAGPSKARGGKVYQSYLPIGTGDIRQFDPVANTNTQFLNQGAVCALPADSRLYFYVITGGNVELRRTTNMTAGTPGNNTIGTINGVITVTGLDNLGKKVFTGTQETGEDGQVHFYPDTSVTPNALSERVRHPVGFRQQTSPNDNNVFLGDILWCFGFREGAGAGFPEAPMLVYVSGGRSNTVGILRPGIFAANTRGFCLSPGFGNQLLMGTNSGDVFAYDIQNSGISQLFDGIGTEDVMSIAYAQGKYYVATRIAGGGATAGKVYATQIPTGSNDNTYPAEAKLLSSTWNFGYPAAWKQIYHVEVITEPLPTGTSVEIQLILDNGTAITTDVNAAIMSHSTASATRKLFQVSGTDTAGAKVQRNCKELRVDIIIKSDTNKRTTPTIRSVEVRAQAPQFVHFIEAIVDLADDTPGMYGLPIGTGQGAANALRTLRDTDPPPPFRVKKIYVSGNNDWLPANEAPTAMCRIEECDIMLTRRGNGFARVLLRRLDL